MSQPNKPQTPQKKILLRRPDDVPLALLSRSGSGESCTKRLSNVKGLTIDISGSASNGARTSEEPRLSKKQKPRQAASLSINHEDNMHWTKRSFDKHRKSISKMTKLIKQSRVLSMPESPVEQTTLQRANTDDVTSTSRAQTSTSPVVSNEREGDDDVTETHEIAETYPLVRRHSKKSRSKPWVSLSEEHGEGGSDGAATTPPNTTLSLNEETGDDACCNEQSPTTNVVIQIEPVTDFSEDHKIIELEDLETSEKINLLICSKQYSSLEVGDKKPLEKKQRSLDLHTSTEFAVISARHLSHSDSSILNRKNQIPTAVTALKLVSSNSCEQTATHLVIPLEQAC